MLDEIRSASHMLAGAAPTFGYLEFGDMARTAERLVIQLLQANALPSVPRLAELQGVLAVLSGSVQASQVATTTSRLAILATQDGIGRDVARVLRRQGYAITLINDLSAARAMPQDLSLHAILVETSRDGFGPVDWLVQLRHRQLMEVPAVFFGEAGNFEARHAAARAGGVGYLLDPLAMPDLPAQLEAMIAPESFRPYRILCVGDGMPSLDGPGLMYRSLTDPNMLLVELEQFRPELLLLSLVMTDYDAIDLARMVWQHGRHADLSIFFAAPKPIAGPTLLAHGITDAYCLSGPLDPVSMRARITRYLFDCRAGLRNPNRAELAAHLPRMAKLGLGSAGGGEVLVARPTTPVAENAGRPGLKILIVDDDEYLVAFLANALSARGMEVLRAYSGEQGYMMAWQHLPNVIISDVEMPNGSGDRMILQLRGNARTRMTPVIIMTGRRWEEGRDYALERELCGRLGAASYLQKPVNMDTLVKELARL